MESGYYGLQQEIEHPGLLGRLPNSISDSRPSAELPDEPDEQTYPIEDENRYNAPTNNEPVVYSNPTVRTRGRPRNRIVTRASPNLVPVEKDPVGVNDPEPNEDKIEDDGVKKPQRGVLTDADINFTLDQFDPMELLKFD
jgi:hypothetical protein